MDTPMQPEVVLSDAELVFRELQTLRQQVQTFETQQRQTQQDNVATQQELGARLQQQQQEALLRSAVPPQQRVVVHPNSPSKMKFVFDGDKMEFPAWKLTIQRRLIKDFTGEQYTGNAEDRWIFINDSLAGPIRKRVSHFFANGQSHGWEAQIFLDHLAVLYSDPRYEDRARLELLSFRQEKKETFGDFFIRFEDQLSRAGLLGLDDRLKIEKLRQAMNTEFDTWCRGFGVSKTNYREAVEKLRDIAEEIEGCRLRAQARNINRTDPTYLEGRVGKDMEGDTLMTGVSTTGFPGNDNDKNGTRAKWVTKDVRDRRRALGQCLKCASEGHQTNQCRLRSARPPVSNTGMRICEVSPETTIENQEGLGSGKDLPLA